MEYVKTFAKFNTTDSASAVREYAKVHRSKMFKIFTVARVSRTLRREPALTQFETAQIANLCPADAEEAKSIVPRCGLAAIESLVTFLTLLLQQLGED